MLNCLSYSEIKQLAYFKVPCGSCFLELPFYDREASAAHLVIFTSGMFAALSIGSRAVQPGPVRISFDQGQSVLFFKRNNHYPLTKWLYSPGRTKGILPLLSPSKHFQFGISLSAQMQALN